MDDENFKTELLSRLERIQSLLSYLCAAAKASEERAQAKMAAEKRVAAEQSEARETKEIERALLQEEMLDDYQQAVQKWKAEKGAPQDQS